MLAFASVTEAIASSSGRGNSDTPLKALIVSSPTFSHEAVIKEAADNQLAIFTEKPVAETADNILDLFAYTEKAGVLLCCSFQRRFDPSYVAATEAVHAGRIGTPVMSHMFFADHPLPPRQFMLTGGNIFMDLSAHDVDYIMHTLQDHVVSVYATGTSSDAELKAAGVYDNATMVMNFSKGRSHKKKMLGRGCLGYISSVLDYDSSQFYLPPHLFFPKGATVTLFMSRSAVYGYDQRCQVFGSAGLVSVENVHDNTAVVYNADGSHKARLQHSFPERFHDAFALELDAFADVLEGSRVWPITGHQCINVQRITDAACLSAETGNVVPVISLSTVQYDQHRL